VLLGDTGREPDWPTGPIPLLIEILEALTTFQLSVAVPVGMITPGLTLICITGSGPNGEPEEAGGEVTAVVADPLLTVTVACLVTDPEAFTAVNV